MKQFRPFHFTFAVLLILAALFHSVSAQSIEGKRIELELDANWQSFDCLAYPAGLCHYYIEDNSGPNYAKLWRFNHYDTSLRQTWSKQIAIPRMYAYESHLFFDGKLYISFLSTDLATFYLLIFEITNGTYLEKVMDSPKGHRVTNSILSPPFLYVSLYSSRTKEVGLFNLLSGTYQSLETVTDKRQEYRGLFYDSSSRVVHVLLHQPISKTIATDKIRIRAYLGKEMIKETDYFTDPTRKVLELSFFSLGADKQLVIGTYAENAKSLANGIMVAGISADRKISVHYYPFSDFKNFYSHLSEKQEKKNEEKNQRKKEQGKEAIVSIRLLNHPPILINGEYLFVSESYYPTYRTEYRTVTRMGANGVYYTTREPYTVFDGYVFDNAIISAYDESGLKLWDTNFSFGYYKTFYLKPAISLSSLNGQLYMHYITYSTIKVVKVTANKELQTVSETIVPILNTGDQVSQTVGMETQFWRNSHYLATGYQKIINKTSDQRKRKVYFIQDIPYK